MNWQIRKLSDLSKNKDAIVSGPFGSNLKVSDYKDSGIPILRLQNIGKGYFIDKDIKYISETKAEELKYHSFKAGDLVLAKLGIPVGKTCTVPSKYARGIIVADVVRIRPDSSIIEHQFLEYFLNSDNSVAQLTGNISGATRPRVNLSDVRNIELKLPPLPEQQKIVEKLDTAFDLIDRAKANIEKNIQNAKELFQSKLNQVFSEKGEGWEEKKLKDIATYFGRGKSKHRPRNWDGLYNGDYPFIQTGDVRNAEKYICTYSQTYNEIGLLQSKLWPKGTICITIAANIAETGILDFEACFPDSIIGLQVNSEKADLDFVYFMLQFFKVELQSLSKGFAQQNINLGTFENKKFPFPKSLEEQKNIVIKLNALLFQTELLQHKYQQKLANLEELKKCILEKAFKGELVH